VLATSKVPLVLLGSQTSLSIILISFHLISIQAPLKVILVLKCQYVDYDIANQIPTLMVNTSDRTEAMLQSCRLLYSLSLFPDARYDLLHFFDPMSEFLYTSQYALHLTVHKKVI
jgi:hypothetical protein